MLAQPGGRFVLILDAEGRADFRVSGTDWADRAKVEALLDNPAIAQKASSLEELARKASLPADALARTVHRWNALVASGEDTELDLFSTSKGTFASPTGVRPRPIVTPPFFAVEMSPLTRKSMGGVAIDMECRALDSAHQPIAGLYAVGEVAGFGGLNGQASIEGRSSRRPCCRAASRDVPLPRPWGERHRQRRMRGSRDHRQPAPRRPARRAMRSTD